FASALVWSIYIIISRRYAKTTPELFAIYCGCGAIISVSMHLAFESTVIPNLKEGIMLIVMGITTHSIAYYAWDYAIKKGHFNILRILPYGNPTISVLALIIFGFAELTIELLISTLMIFAAGIIGSYRFNEDVAFAPSCRENYK
ncbi:EamA family transporter, partial [Rickettsiaceae bacterium]|nr:EamA family transporter [Rickettsiaceae bacterium]